LVSDKSFPVVSVIIPHLKGEDILRRCLKALQSCTYPSIEVILVDNGSTDGSSERIAGKHPGVRLIRSTVNLGYAGGCNMGLSHASGKYALLLNDDAEVTAGFLEPLVACMESDASIGACQPKIKSIIDSTKFDYAGAAGGYLDRFGYPFCMGRIFDTVEVDRGQYDDPREIFWASGACCLIRISALEETGRFDESFFAHMEEIDLHWRMRLAGYKIMSVPSSIVHHEAGTTLAPEAPQKVYLNHRNGLMMLVKNHRPGMLLWILPARSAASSLVRLRCCVLWEQLSLAYAG
jgi:GT2 family glycosyltransferase